MKKKLDTDVEGMMSDYKSEPEMSEEYGLKYLENELTNSTVTLLHSLVYKLEENQTWLKIKVRHSIFVGGGGDGGGNVFCVCV